MAPSWETVLRRNGQSLRSRIKELNHRAEVDDSYYERDNPFRQIARDLVTSRYLISLDDSSSDREKDVSVSVSEAGEMNLDPAEQFAHPRLDLTHSVLPISGQSRTATVSMLDYLGSPEFKIHIESVTDSGIEANTVLPCLASILNPWQAIGQEKLCRLGKSSFRGGFLADPVGLGKSLTALIAALRLRDELPAKGFVLVVCRKSCTFQWYDEIQRHFKKDQRPSAVVLDRTDYPVRQLLKFDVVITSHSFVRQRYLDLYLYESFHDTVSGMSLAVARDVFGVNGLKKIYMPLHSPLYEILNRPTSVLIFDESQDAKNSDTALWAALKSLKYQAIFLLSGTPAYNTLDDIYGQMSLLPGCPILSLQHFQALFNTGKITSSESGGRNTLDDPANSRMLLLKRFMAGILVARPKKILNLPALLEKDIPVALNWTTHAEVLFAIELIVSRAKQLLGQSKECSRTQSRRLRRQAFSLFWKAQSFSSSPLLSCRLTEGEWDQTEYAAHIESVTREFDRFITISKDLNSDSTITSLNEDQRRAFLRWLSQHSGPGGSQSRNAARDEEEDVSNESSDEESTLIEDLSSEFDSSEKPKRPQWLTYLQSRPDGAIFSPRICSITNTVKSILEKPNDKIMIVSNYIMFLDIIRVALERNAIRAKEFNGTIASSEARAEVLRDFNDPLSNSAVLLCTVGAGGTGLNITGANHLLISEPLWSPGQEEQIKGRVYRMGQRKPVTVYHLYAEDSRIDTAIRSANREKAAKRNDLMLPLVRDDRREFIIPRLPTVEELFDS
ncbi:P-loop containing nucleoside triphosphate hydrolase protein [Daldinia loculata]|uniref:P-loop containing nucleoside triphosphate hydrolase protein n=1 Tax=Daldinia loculata TaxID=103429 RepID=UPI0020C2ADD1|nr:P-loop containing nucleoside triphosphate hydrolase protein [Daldinia loculata]KAI1647842.1 P-loop containing nucleoside triphosphate hydrolase protein [Daldinia loculata]